VQILAKNEKSQYSYRQNDFLLMWIWSQWKICHSVYRTWCETCVVFGYFSGYFWAVYLWTFRFLVYCWLFTWRRILWWKEIFVKCLYYAVALP